MYVAATTSSALWSHAGGGGEVYSCVDRRKHARHLCADNPYRCTGLERRAEERGVTTQGCDKIRFIGLINEPTPRLRAIGRGHCFGALDATAANVGYLQYSVELSRPGDIDLRLHSRDTPETYFTALCNASVVQISSLQERTIKNRKPCSYSPFVRCGCLHHTQSTLAIDESAACHSICTLRQLQQL